MMKVNVLDKGWVCLVDRMGNDLRVCQAARVSTGGGASKGDKKDKGLISYLWKNKHQTPFEKVVFEFHVKCPIFVARQWFRHRIGSFNEASARYKEFEWECYEPNEWRMQDDKNTQGSLGAFEILDQTNRYNRVMNDAYKQAKHFYDLALDEGVAREQARTVMPVGQYTEFFWTVNFRSLANFITLRSHEHAQKEIQEYADALLMILEEQEDLKWTVEIFEKMLYIEHQMSYHIENNGVDSFMAFLDTYDY